MLRVADDGLETGGDFYIQRDDDLATFKRIAAIDEDKVTLKAINAKKYPDLIVIEHQRMVRAARAVFILNDA